MSIFIDNKYTKHYYIGIKRRQIDVLTSGYEQHHIIPRSLGGTDDPDNIVRLTAREHIIAHWALTKMVAGPARYKMEKAFAMMMADPLNRGKRKLSTIEAAKCRESNRISTLEQWKDPDFVDMQRNKARTQWQDPEFAARMCENGRTQMKKNWEDLDYRTRSIARMQAQVTTQDFRENQSKRMRERWQDLEYAEKMRNVSAKSNETRLESGSHNFLNSDIQKITALRRISDGTHNFTQVHTCPHCGKVGKGPQMKRYHFDACKSK